ncbi:ABC transporter substrate-binding protein [Ostreibacterium oceani]|uniref:ABC transporter substrate-binding protein n=1 Tax=Ostreibacterium oceani TaxID=2654998 RepID=A0A6N7EX63_9GAMM|nr:ABC transporter substrate-binding protein [Ostreibacterium oceani]MPV85999.1 ABC transporter substrate-binding protein [Ostreibacterium oceani]
MKKLFLSTSIVVAVSNFTTSSFAGDCPPLVANQADGQYPHIFVDAAAFEQKHSCTLSFKENPNIATLNSKIKGNPELPTVNERLPDEPLVIAPYQAIGTYGGVFDGISKATESGTSDLLSVRHVNLVRFSDDLQTIVPNVAKSWQFNNEFTELTLILREGHKWSDGHPFTAHDVAYWYNNLLRDEKVISKMDDRFLAGGKPWTVEVIDDTTVKISLAAPQPGLLGMFATDFAQPFQPKHLLSQFDPKVSDDADTKAKELGFKDAYEALTFYYGQSDWKDVPTPINKNKALSDKLVAAGYPATAPTLESFIVVEDTAEGRRLVANPYFFQVDTAGNQLPYIDEIKEVFISDENIQTAKMIAGEIDYKAQSVNVPAAPVLLENRDKGNYDIALRPNIALTSFSFNVNDKNPELAEVFSDIRFRKAASHALNRPKMNEIGFLNLGKPMQYTVFDPDTTPFVNDEQRNYLTDYNPEKAKALLDEMGIMDSDGDGVRELPSGESFELSFRFTTQGIATEIAEIFTQNMTDIGIKTALKEVTSDEYRNAQSANDLSIMQWQVGQPLAVLASDPSTFKAPFGNFFSIRNGLDWTKYNDTNGKEGVQQPEAFVEIANMADKFTTLSMGSDASNQLGKELVDNWLEQLLIIGTVKGASPIYYSRNLGNFEVPKTSSYEYYRVYPYMATQWYLKP